jgi:hypothetical protein
MFNSDRGLWRYINKFYKHQHFVEESIVSTIETQLTRFDSFDRLIKLGLDPLVYSIKPFDNSQGEAIFESWWFRCTHHLVNKVLFTLYPERPGFLPRGEASSPQTWNKNLMY